MGCGRTPSDSSVARSPWRSSWGSAAAPPRPTSRTRRRRHAHSTARSPARTTGSGTRTSGRAPAERAQREPHDRLVDSVSGPASSSRLAPVVTASARPQRGSRQRTPPRRRPRSAGRAPCLAPVEGWPGGSEKRSSSVSHGSRGAYTIDGAQHRRLEPRLHDRPLRQRLGAQKRAEECSVAPRPRRRRSARRPPARRRAAAAAWPPRSAPRSRRRGWSRMAPARWTTRVDPAQRVAERAGSARSPSAICTRTRSAPEPRADRGPGSAPARPRRQAPQQRRADGAARAGQQDHGGG